MRTPRLTPAEPWRGGLRRLIARPESRVHLMGVGGIGMAGLARLLSARGLRVSGCDAGTPRTLDWLRSCGLPVVTGHDRGHLADTDWAVYSPALAPGHPEREEAVRRGIPLFRRGQALAVVGELWRTIAVAGTHGKTTTSSMVAHMLRSCGTMASWCIGGELAPTGAPAEVGAGEWLVIEADESDGTLAHHAPEMAVITNVEFDHMEHFAAKEAMEECFRTFARQAGFVVYGAEDPVASRLGRDVGGIGVGCGEGADFRADGIQPGRGGTRFRVRAPGGRVVQVDLPLTGRHNVLNALTALAACDRVGVDWAAAAAALATFRLPRRRFEVVAAANGIRIVADYAHHPSEIRALIDAARQAGAVRIRAAFQPHRYTRTQALGPQFPPAFNGVDEVVLLPVYAASEPPLAGGSSADLQKHFRRHGDAPVELAESLEDAAARLSARWQAGDWILIVGAGDVEELGPMLKSRLIGDEKRVDGIAQ